MRFGLLLALTACSPAAPPVQGPPAAPVLEEVAGVQRRRMFTLRGTAADEAVVRLFADAACAGPVTLQTTGAGLVAGVQVELIPGAENLFSANAVSQQGLTSDCSPALRLRYVPALRPGRPSVGVQPTSPSRELDFAIRGTADPMTRVQLHEGSCVSPVLAELSAVEFFDAGFRIELVENQTRTLAVEAINEDMNSDCVAVTLINDRTSPEFSVRLASPTPSPQQSAWLVFSGDADELAVEFTPDCSGPVEKGCVRCVGLVVGFPPDASTTFSVRGRDRAGNTTCVTAQRPWVHDPSLPEGEAMVLAPPVLLGADYRMLVEVPVGRAYVGLFHSADCSGPPKPVPLAYQAVFYGVYLEGLPTGFVSMRSFRQDGGADPCSNAVPWR